MCLCGMFLADTDLCVTDDTPECFMIRHKERKWVRQRGSFAYALCLLSPVASLGWKKWSECERDFHGGAGCEDRLWLPVTPPPTTLMVGGGWGGGGWERLEALRETSGQKGC